LTVEPTPQSEKDVLGNAFVAMVGDLRKAMREIGKGVDGAAPPYQIVSRFSMVLICRGISTSETTRSKFSFLREV
jgi:hypothetical protein